MSARTHKAIFERWEEPADHFGEAKGAWQEVCKECVTLKPVAILAQRQEFIENSQTTGTRKSIATLIWSLSRAAIDTSCRMKIRRYPIVNEVQPEDDANYRIFHIDAMLNVDELNKELQLMVVEKQ